MNVTPPTLRNLICIGLLGLSFSLYASEVRVGVYENEPKIFTAADGKPSGILIDLLKEIASKEDWQLTYVPCEWDACLKKLEAGDIDLMPDVAHSETRAQKFDFHATPALHSWSQIYRREGVAIYSILDLKGKRIALLGEGIQEDAFKAMLSSFNIDAQLIRTKNMNDAFLLTQTGQADAVIANHYFGDYHKQDYQLSETPILFQPVSMFYGTAQGRRPDLLQGIEDTLSVWHNDPGSPYFDILKRWEAHPPERFIPSYAWNVLASITALMLASLAGVLFLRRQIRIKRQELSASNSQLQATLDAIQDSIFEVGLDGRFYSYHSARHDLLAAPPEVFLGKTIAGVLPPDVAEIAMSGIREAMVNGRSEGKEYALPLPSGKHWFELSIARKQVPNESEPRFIALAHDITRRKTDEAKILRLTKLYAALSQCNQAIVRCDDEAELFQLLCQIAVQYGGMRMAWIGKLDQTTRSIVPVAAYGHGTEYLENIDISTDADKPSGRGPTGTAVREDSPFWCQDFQHDPTTAAWHERGAQFAWAGSASLPLHQSGAVIGSFTLYADEINAFDQAAQNLLTEMALDISFALDRFAQQTQRTALERQLAENHALIQMASKLARIGGWALELSPEPRVIWSDEVCDIHEEPHGTQPTLEQAIQFYVPEYQPRIQELVEKCIQDGTPFDEELQLITATGKRIWVRAMGQALRDDNGGIIRIQGAFQDISLIKLAEEEKLSSEVRYHLLFESMSSGFALHDIICDANGEPVDYRFLEANPAFEKLTGLKAKDIIGRTVREVIPTVEDFWIERYGQVALKGVATNFEYSAAGLSKDFEVFAYSPKHGQFATLFSDITERLQMQQSLLKLSMAVEQSPASVVITDLDANIQFANQTFSNTTGYSLDELRGKNPRILQSGKTPKQTYDDMWAHLTRGENWQGELINRRKDGSEYIESATISPVHQADGRITAYLAIKEDITAKKQTEERIERLAHFDQLTGLPNRTLLNERFNYAASLAQRNGEQLTVMFIDLDHFKNINDTLGHSIGDKLLMEVALRLKHALREQDTISRQGGDEFILVLPGTDENGAAHTASKLMKAISEPYTIAHHEMVATPSIGIAIYPNDGESFEILLKNADTAMYRVKQQNRNDFCFFTQEMQAHSVRTLELSNALRHALARDQLSLHYQPQISIEDGHVIGVEALLRWQHPELGAISPAEFIPIAENSGRIIQIGEWVLRTATKQLKTWMDSGLPPMMMAVNLSAVQFRHPSLSEVITNILDEFDLPPEYLELELTEAVAMDDPQAAVKVMDKLHEQGIRMSIDDFGTGYSSLNYLKRFKVYKLKIDQSFVRDITHDSEDKALVTAIINMAASLGMQTIAEGVETGGQLAFLRLRGCDEVQGYYFSKPLPADELAAYIRNQTL